MIDEYEINSATLAIIPIDEKSSRVYEEETEYVVNKNVNTMVVVIVVDARGQSI